VAVTLEGTDAELEDATVLIFPEDEAKVWYSSPFMRSARTAERRSIPQRIQWNDGRSFTMTALPAGRYYAIAVASLEQGQETNPALLRQLTAIASKVELMEDETRQLALRMTRLP
jgi:hypothetical protein